MPMGHVLNPAMEGQSLMPLQARSWTWRPSTCKACSVSLNLHSIPKWSFLSKWFVWLLAALTKVGSCLSWLQPKAFLLIIGKRGKRRANCYSKHHNPLQDTLIHWHIYNQDGPPSPCSTPSPCLSVTYTDLMLLLAMVIEEVACSIVQLLTVLLNLQDSVLNIAEHLFILI